MTRPELNLVLASDQPKELAEFYLFVMGGEIRSGLNDSHYLICDKKGTEIHFYRPSSNQSLPTRGRVLSICFKGPSSSRPLLEIKNWSLKLISRGASFLDDPRLEPFGAEAWIADPEGNQFLILVPLN